MDPNKKAPDSIVENYFEQHLKLHFEPHLERHVKQGFQ